MMKKPILFSLLTILIATFAEGKTMKLINTENQKVIVAFVDDQTIFHDPILEKQMHHHGIAIPSYLRHAYGGKARIYPEDPLFQKAFKEVFYSHCIDNKELFQWQENQ